MQEADELQQQRRQPHQLQQSSSLSIETVDDLNDQHHDKERQCQVDSNNISDLNSRNTINDFDKSLSIDDDENNNDSMVVSLDMSQNNEQPMSASEEVSEDPSMINKDVRDCDGNNESGDDQMIDETKLGTGQADDINLYQNQSHPIELQMQENSGRLETIDLISSDNQEIMDNTKNGIPENVNDDNNNDQQQQQQHLNTKMHSSMNSTNKDSNFNVGHKRTKNTCSKACCPKHHHHHKHNYHQHYHQHSTDETKTKYISQTSYHNHDNNCVSSNNVGSSSANIAREDIPNSSTSLSSTKLGHDRKLSRLSDRSDTLPSSGAINNSNKNNDSNNASSDLAKCHHSSHLHHHHNQSHGHHHHHRHHHHNNKKRSQEMIDNHDDQATTNTSDFTKHPSQSKFATSAKVVSSSSNDDNNNYCNESKQCPSSNHCAHSHHYHRHQSKHDQHCLEVRINESKSSKSLSTCSQSSSTEIGCATKMQTVSSSSSATVTSATTVISNASGPLTTKARILDKLDERQQQYNKHQSSHKPRSMSVNIDEDTLPAPIGFQNELQSFKIIQDDVIRENEPMDSSNNISRLSAKDNANNRKHNEQNSATLASTQQITCCNHRLNSQGKSQRHHHHHHNHHHHHQTSAHREHQAVSFSHQQPIQNTPGVQLAPIQQGSTSNQSDNQSVRYSHKHHHHHHHGHHKHKHKLKHRVGTSSHANEAEKPVNSNNEQISIKNSTSSIISTVDASGVNLNNQLSKKSQNIQSDVSVNDCNRIQKSTNDVENGLKLNNQQSVASSCVANTMIDVEITSVDPSNGLEKCDTLRAIDTEMIDNMTSDNSLPRKTSQSFARVKNEVAKVDEDDGKMVLDQDDRISHNVNICLNGGIDSSAIINMDMSNSLDNDSRTTLDKSKNQQSISESTTRSDRQQVTNTDSNSMVTLQMNNKTNQTRQDELVISCQPVANTQSSKNDRLISNEVVKEAADHRHDIDISNSNRHVDNNLETKENIFPSSQLGTNSRLSSKGSVEKDSHDLLTIDPIKCSSSNFSVGDVATTQVKGVDYVNTDRRCKLCWCCCCPCSGLSHRSICHRDSKLSLNNGGDRTNQTSRCDMMPTCGTPSLEEIRSWGESFDRLMKCYDGRRVFRDFLRCEYSEENILFWLACQELKREKDLRSIEAKARMIYEDYISILSTKEVSLDSRVREVINKNMESPKADIFDEAQLQIYTLMHRDSYPRFINSSMYKKLAQLPTSSRKSSS